MNFDGPHYLSCGSARARYCGCHFPFVLEKRSCPAYHPTNDQVGLGLLGLGLAGFGKELSQRRQQGGGGLKKDRPFSLRCLSISDVLRPTPYLSRKLTRPLRTKDGGALRTLLDVRRAHPAQWQRAAGLLLDEADVAEFSRAVELVLFYDAKLVIA